MSNKIKYSDSKQIWRLEDYGRRITTPLVPIIDSSKNHETA